jgi:hypothetical protein
MKIQMQMLQSVATAMDLEMKSIARSYNGQNSLHQEPGHLRKPQIQKRLQNIAPIASSKNHKGKYHEPNRIYFPVRPKLWDISKRRNRKDQYIRHSVE